MNAVEVECKGCGKRVLSTLNGGRPRKYCSCECRMGSIAAAQRAERRAITNDVLQTKLPCIQCGQKFTRQSIRQLLCSEVCAHERRKEQKLKWRIRTLVGAA